MHDNPVTLVCEREYLYPMKYILAAVLRCARSHGYEKSASPRERNLG